MTAPYLADPDVTLYVGDCIDVLRDLPAESVDCCVTSPPYYGLRDYGVDGQIGLEDTPEAFIGRLVDVFSEVRRVLAPHGTCWVNLGDSYAANRSYQVPQSANPAHDYGASNALRVPDGLKPKDLLMMPARLALAMQADGWWLRGDIIWHKPNPMPESVTDRPTSAHEHVFLFTKAPRYWYDAEAIKEAASSESGWAKQRACGEDTWKYGRAAGGNTTNGVGGTPGQEGSRNARNVWTIATQPYPGAHFATFPRELPRRCIVAGCPEHVCRVCGEPRVRIVERERTMSASVGGAYSAASSEVAGCRETNWSSGGTTRVEHRGWSDCGHGDYRPGIVLDPFAGSGTTLDVARRNARHGIGIELNAEYAALAADRLRQLSLLGQVGA